MRWGRMCAVALFAVVLLPSLAAAQADKFDLNGYFQAQYGLFTNTEYHNESDIDGFPSNHGDRAGKPSMLRHTLLLEADWRPFDNVKVHAVFRGVRSGSLAADRFAQTPDMEYNLKYNHDPEVMDAKIHETHKRYYNENELREIYVDIDATDKINLRVGRQQVSWGDMATYRLLDVVNPVDGSWHLPPFEAFEDTRKPLYMAKLLIDVPCLQGNLETLYIPLIDDPEDTVTTPATFYGAWGLPVGSKNDYVSDLRIVDKITQYPKNDLSDARVGARWKGILGGLTYTLVAYHGHQLTPPIPDYVVKSWEIDDEGFHNADVYLRVPRLNTYGFSVDYAFESPVGMVVKLEAAVTPEVQYAVNSPLSAGFTTDNRVASTWEAIDPSAGAESDLRADMHSEERHHAAYALELFRSNQIRFINRKGSIITVFRIFQDYYFNPEDINEDEYKLGNPYVLETLADGSQERNENWHIVYAGGYDSTLAAPIRTTLVAAAFTSYFHGMFTPGVVAVYLPRYPAEIVDSSDVFDWETMENGSGFVSATFKFSFGNHWRLATGYNYIQGADPYYDLGFFRDRDEVFAKVRYQF
jgi:Protein of unknown function (DUF1302)